MEQLTGLHHLTAITSDANKNYDFYTRIMGMRLLKKTVNQDDINAYHTFFGDEMASAGNDLTFFDFNSPHKAVPGTNSISSVGLRVPSDKALDYWVERFNKFEIEHEGIDSVFGIKGIRFKDFDGLKLRLISDEINGGFAPGVPNTHSDVPKENAIVGLATMEIMVRHDDIQHNFLTKDLRFTHTDTDGSMKRYETGPGGNSSSIHVIKNQTLGNEIQGAGAVHHLALRVPNDEVLNEWVTKMREKMYPNSGYVERHYFQSLYTRIGSILYEFATDTPGFTVDEPIETLGEKLSLPPFLEDQRTHIEKTVRPFDTKRVNYGL